MKNVLATLLLLATLCTAAHAQTIVFLPDPSATLIGTFQIRLNVERDPQGNPILGKTASGTDWITSIGSFRTQQGAVAYQIITESIDVIGTDGALINDVTTEQLYTWLSQAAVAEGTRLGYTPAPPCLTPASIKSYAHPCVQRNGSGLNTSFTACAGQGMYSMWEYAVCMPQGATTAQVSLVNMLHLGTCIAPCEPTSPVAQQGNQLQ